MAPTTQSIELTTGQGTPTTEPTSRTPSIFIGHSDADPENGVFQHLKPADGGFHAWMLLFSAFVFEALLWGFPVTFGVFQNYYSTLPQYAGNSKIPLIGTIAQGLSYLGAPISAAVTHRFPKYQRVQIYIGWPLCISGLVAGSFTTSLDGLILTQGVMYAIGFVTFTYPIINMVDEWWIRRKGLALGAISAASGASGVFMPFIMNLLLTRYGYQTTLRAVAVAMVVLTGPLIPTLRFRLPPSERGALKKMDWSFWKKPLWWLYCISTLIYGLGFFFPSIYLPSYATAIGLSSTQGALLLSIMSLAQVFGQFAFGWVSDKKVPVSVLAIICSFVTAIATFALWGMAKSLALLLVFSIVYGFFGCGFTSMRAAMGRAVSDDPSAVVATYSILVFVQGVGNVLVGPISSGLLKGKVYVGGYGIERYKALVIFTGGCMAASALTIGMWYLRPKRNRLFRG